MATRAKPRAPKAPPEVVDLQEGGRRINYSGEYLRKLIWTSEDPPPFRKHRGRYVATWPELEAWAQRRDGAA